MNLATILDPRNRRVVGAGAVGTAIVVVLIVILVMNSVAPIAGDPSPSASGTPSQSAGPSGEPGGSDAWTALDLPAFEPVAKLEPATQGRYGVDPGTSFRLVSLDGTPATQLAAKLQVSPPAPFRVSAGGRRDTAIVTPETRLTGNARYTFQLRAPDGSLAAEWTFRTAGPPQIVRTLPYDRSTDVPVDTGIEVEFDEDGVTDVEGHFRIDPAVDGHFERHGRTWAFVPDANLARGQLYTVTLTPGIRLGGSDEVVRERFRFQFETTGERSRSEPHIITRSWMQDIQPLAPLAVYVEAWGGPDRGRTLTRAVDIYALPDRAAALEAARQLSVDRAWAMWSSTGSVQVAGLRRVDRLDATIETNRWPALLSVPISLPRGWYLLNLTQTGRDAQVLIQVGNIAVAATASDTRTVVWVNNLGSRDAIAGALVALDGGGTLGTTDGRGLLDVGTPASVLAEAAAASMLIVAAPGGRSVITPLRRQFAYAPYYGLPDAEDWWLVFDTDREQYRQRDAVHAWGVVRSRDERSVPGDVEVRLTAAYDSAAPTIARVAVSPTARGTFRARVPIDGLPLGDYLVSLFVGEERLSSSYIQVTEIRKPTFRLDVSTDRLAYVRGDLIHARAEANFFDGSAAPGIRLSINSYGTADEDDHVLTADASGVVAFTPRAAGDAGQLGDGTVFASVAEVEEGSSYGDASFIVLPSRVWVSADAALRRGEVHVDGSVHAVDLELAGREFDRDGWVTKPIAQALAGQDVSVVVTYVEWVPREAGTTYDFLQKKRVPRYEYHRREERIGAFTARSNADGRYQLDVPIADAEGFYEISVSASDSSGRRMTVRTAASASGFADDGPSVQPRLLGQVRGGERGAYITAGIGDDVSVTLRDADGTIRSGDRTLFLVASRGIRETVVTTAGRLDRTFAEGDIPGLTVRAIQLSRGGYLVPDDIRVSVKPEAKHITVVATPDREAYAPGSEVRLALRTTGPSGAPIATDVVISVVDQKMYAIGAARRIDTGGLLRDVRAGLVRSYYSHPLNPQPEFGDGYGATTGGGERSDFEDVAYFGMATTDGSGRGAVRFRLPDDLTSWHISAGAVGDGLESGSLDIEIPATLPLFVDPVIAADYLEGDQPTIQIRAFGRSLTAGEAVRFTVAAPSLGIARTVREGQAFTPTWVALPELPVGDHRITIGVRASAGGTVLRDRVVRIIHVRSTRLSAMLTSAGPMEAGSDPPGGEGMTTYLVTDAGRGALAPMLSRLATATSARFDDALAADIARRILVDTFAMDETSLPPSGYDPARGQMGGIRLLPYDAPDLFLSARTALVAPERVNLASLREALRQWMTARTANRERRIVALSGLAGLGENTLVTLRAACRREITIREQLWCGLGLLAAGDGVAARRLERDVLAEHGQRLGQWIRVDAGEASSDGIEATGLALLLAARLGDPLATDMARYLEDNPSREQVVPLESIGYAQAALEWLPREPARFRWSVDGERHVVNLEPGAGFTLAVTGPQRQSLEFEPLLGSLWVLATWFGPATYETLPDHPMLGIERTVSPAGNAPTNGLVRVSLRVSAAADAPRGCLQVTDLLPSGLAPLTGPRSWFEDESGEIGPYEVVGQRVSWCIDRRQAQTKTLTYTARVVSAGTYRWEPAVVQSVAAPEVGSATAPITYQIR